jgi:hypothetical protein
MDRVIIKNIIIVSLILGAILGVLAPIPYVGLFMLLVALLLAAPIVVIFLIMAGKCDLTTTKDSIITGAIVGFSTNITFSIAYSLLMVILSLGFHYSSNFFLTAMIINSPIWLIGVFIIFIGVLTATTNAFSAFATYYIINLIRDMYEKSHPNNDNYKNM